MPHIFGLPSAAARPRSTTSTELLQPCQPFWFQLLIRISILGGWFSERLRRYARVVQEAWSEAAEERRMRSQLDVGTSTSTEQRRCKSKSTASPLTSFPKFGLLPPEIRQQIWVDALPESRVLMLQLPRGETLTDFILRPINMRRKRRASMTAQMDNTWHCNVKVPAILQVNSESRAMAQKHYRLGLAPGDSQSRIYVDFSRDVIGLSNEVMESPSGRNLWRLTRDLNTETRHLALASAGSRAFLNSRKGRKVMAVAENIAIVDSAIWSAGVVPPVAQLDWDHWIKWQCAKGEAHWCLRRVKSRGALRSQGRGGGRSQEEGICEVVVGGSSA